MSASRRNTIIGSLLALVTVSIWAFWIIGTRQAAGVSLPIAWIGILRFLLPTLVLAPFWLRVGLLPKGVNPVLLAVMVVGAGAGFVATAAYGIRFAYSAEAGVLLQGTLPLWVAILAAIFEGERYGWDRMLGFALIFAAIFATGGAALFAGHGWGIVFIPLSSLLWAFYTLAFRRIGIGALEAAGLISVWSLILFLPFALFADPRAVLGLPLPVLGTQILSHAILSGIVAVITYGAAVRLLGSTRTAVFSSLAPALATLFAIPILGEIPTPLAVVGVILAVAGVILGSGALSRRAPVAAVGEGR